MGRDPNEIAQIGLWERYSELSGAQGGGEYFRNGFSKLYDRGLPGLTGIPRIEALVDRGARRIASFYEVIEQRIGESEYLGSDRFTLADITALRAVDFATIVKHGVPNGNENTERWYAVCSSRPSAKA